MYEAKVQFEIYNRPLPLETKGANAIHIENRGDVTCLINQKLRLRPGETWAVNHVTPSTIDTTEYILSFSTTDSGTTGTTQDVIVSTVFNKELLGQTPNRHQPQNKM